MNYEAFVPMTGRFDILCKSETMHRRLLKQLDIDLNQSFVIKSKTLMLDKRINKWILRINIVKPGDNPVDQMLTEIASLFIEQDYFYQTTIKMKIGQVGPTLTKIRILLRKLVKKTLFRINCTTEDIKGGVEATFFVTKM